MGNSTARQLSASLEDYLEAVWLLVRRDRVARVRDIAERLKVGMPSVTAALKSLAKRKLVKYDPYQVVTLTAAGRSMAEEISGRHRFLREFLTGVLGLDNDAAEANACRLEHAVDAELLERLRSFTRFIERCPRLGEDWVAKFQEFRSEGEDPSRCRQCLRSLLDRFDETGEE